jgi:hypothetical protein
MGRTLYVLLLVMLAGCSTSQPLQKAAEALPSANATYPSPDGSLCVTICHSKKPYTVEVIERESGKVLGVAGSSVVLTESGDRMQGEMRVTYSGDLSTIIVHEDFSDAAPNPHYILFQRRRGSAAYRVSYLAPPTARTDAPGDFDFVCPRIKSITDDTITLDYCDGRTRVIRIADVLQSTVPKGALEWPDEAYKRYDGKP